MRKLLTYTLTLIFGMAVGAMGAVLFFQGVPDPSLEITRVSNTFQPPWKAVAPPPENFEVGPTKIVKKEFYTYYFWDWNRDGTVDGQMTRLSCGGVAQSWSTFVGSVEDANALNARRLIDHSLPSAGFQCRDGTQDRGAVTPSQDDGSPQIEACGCIHPSPPLSFHRYAVDDGFYQDLFKGE